MHDQSKTTKKGEYTHYVGIPYMIVIQYAYCLHSYANTSIEFKFTIAISCMSCMVYMSVRFAYMQKSQYAPCINVRRVSNANTITNKFQLSEKEKYAKNDNIY